MEQRLAGYYVDVINISVHTTFDLQRDPKTELLIATLFGVPGIVDVVLKRYSIEIEAGFLFEIHSIKAVMLDIVKDFYELEEIAKITTKDLAERAAQRQLESLEDMEEDSMPNLLLSLMERSGVSEA